MGRHRPDTERPRAYGRSVPRARFGDRSAPRGGRYRWVEHRCACWPVGNGLVVAGSRQRGLDHRGSLAVGRSRIFERAGGLRRRCINRWHIHGPVRWCGHRAFDAGRRPAARAAGCVPLLLCQAAASQRTERWAARSVWSAWKTTSERRRLRQRIASRVLSPAARRRSRYSRAAGW